MILLAAEGVIDGGWSYVWASYILTWLVLGGYVVYLVVLNQRNGR